MERRNSAAPRVIRHRDLTDEDLEERLKIDRFRLEEMRAEHPELLHEVASRLARLISFRDQAKQSLKETEARAAAKMRHQAEVEGEKVVETRITSELLLDKEVMAEKDKAFEWDEKVGRMAALKEAFSDRSYALRDLVQLYCINYYGSDMEKPTPRSAHAEQARERQRETFRR